MDSIPDSQSFDQPAPAPLREGPEEKADTSPTLLHPPSFPSLSNDSTDISDIQAPLKDSSNPDEDPAIANSFDRSESPATKALRNQGAVYKKVGEDGSCKMHKFSLYETASRYYVVGGDLLDQRFRILKIDRTSDSGDLTIAEDDIIYTKVEMNQLLNAIDDGNKGSGGMKLKCSMWGLLGFIRFTGPYYMLLITKRSQVAMLGGHYIYQIDGTELVPLTSPASSRFKLDRNTEESRFLGILDNLDLSRSFYFSYSYDITHTLQHNISRERAALQRPEGSSKGADYNPMFVWNEYLLEPAMETLQNTYDWCIPIVHGYVDQATLSVYGRMVFITIIARRSRFFAGARFLKRGANDLGYVANDVETEQIVSEMLTTSFHGPGPELYSNPNYTSYIQHRGSIPLYWTQDNTGVNPKPPIELNLIDPFYGAAALHFDDLFGRYGAPIYVLNLVKSRERTPRESKLLVEYTKAIQYLNQFLPNGKKIIYKAWDMSRASKSHDQDVIGTLENIAEDIVSKTGFFRNGDDGATPGTMQNGVARTNCIDCLDRTNAAQFVIGKRALGHQLYALGIIETTTIDYDTDAVNLFTHMYHDHGDTIAVQYGGSHLVNTMETYRKINQWTSHSRDMVESFKRYYNNSFLDSQRQEAYNLFLGNYIFTQGQPMLWDLSTDYYLHHADPRAWSQKKKRSYIEWYKPESLEERQLPQLVPHNSPGHTHELPEAVVGFWQEYYRPLALSSFQKIFSYKMNSTLRYIPFKSTQDGRYDLSPFRVRTGTDQEVPEKKSGRKGVTIIDPQDDSSDTGSNHTAQLDVASKRISIQRWLQPQVNDKPAALHGIIKGSKSTVMETSNLGYQQPDGEKSSTLWTLDEFVTHSLSPSVTLAEAEEYQRYVSHPLNLPLVVSTETPPNPSLEFLEYVKGISSESMAALHSTEDDLAEYADFLNVADDPLTVSKADAPKKRYKAYRRWLKGKPLFKQQRDGG